MESKYESLVKTIEDIEHYLEDEIRIQDFEMISINKHSMNSSFVKKCITSFFVTRYWKKNIKEFIDFFEKNENILYFDYCKKCQRKIEFIIDSKNKTITEIDVPCTLVDMVEFDVYFESGKLLLGVSFEYLESIFKEIDGIEDVNYVSGQIERTMNYAKENVIHLFSRRDDILLANKNEKSLFFCRESNIEIECKNTLRNFFVVENLYHLTIFDIENIKKRINSIESKELQSLLMKKLEEQFQNLKDSQKIVELKAGKYHVKYNLYTNDIHVDLISTL